MRAMIISDEKLDRRGPTGCADEASELSFGGFYNQHGCQAIGEKILFKSGHNPFRSLVSQKIKAIIDLTNVALGVVWLS